MKGILHNVVQGSQEWHQLRLGNLTASSDVPDLLAKTKSGWAASHDAVIAKKITERLTNCVAETFQNDAMRWGTEQEPHARSLYSFLHQEATPTGIWEHAEIKGFLASPDGLVGDEGLLEIKCCASHTHINEYLLGEKIGLRYSLQMQAQLAVTGRKWVDFCAFDPRLPSEMQLWVKRVFRDEKIISEMIDHVQVALVEIENTVSALRSKYLKENSNGQGRINGNTSRHSDENQSRIRLVSAHA